MEGQTDGRMNGRADVWMNGWPDREIGSDMNRRGYIPCINVWLVFSCGHVLVCDAVL